MDGTKYLQMKLAKILKSRRLLRDLSLMTTYTLSGKVNMPFGSSLRMFNICLARSSTHIVPWEIKDVKKVFCE